MKFKNLTNFMRCNTSQLLPLFVLREASNWYLQRVFQQSSQYQGRFLLGTVHKSGTVLMSNIFKTLSFFTNIKFWDSSSYSKQIKPIDWNICFDGHAEFLKVGSEIRTSIPTVIIIRDPRDIVVSSVYYHMTASEEWLHYPRDVFGGMTYQQKLRSLSNKNDRFIFEMENVAGEEIKKMIFHKDTFSKNTLFVKLEDLVEDRQLEIFSSIFRFVGMEAGLILFAKKIAFEQSVFYPAKIAKGHVRRATRGQWQEEFDSEVVSEFYTRFKDVPERFGY